MSLLWTLLLLSSPGMMKRCGEGSLSKTSFIDAIVLRVSLCILSSYLCASPEGDQI